MSSFKELIKTGKVKTAWHKKQALVGSIQTMLTEIGSLDTNNPNVRIFARTHEGAIALLDELVQASRELNLTLFEQNPAIYTDVDYKADTQSDVALRLTLRSDLDRYIEVMSTKNIQFPPAVDPAAPVAENVDLTQILNALVKSQTDNAAASNAQQVAVAQQHKETLETLQKHGQAGPKASQPFFTPKNSDADYEIYSEFIQRFKNFVIKCTDEVKLQWLQSSVKSDALLLIKHLSPSNANYAIALERLEKRFNNPEVIKHNLVQSILNFKADSNPRYTKVVSAITGFANALEELKTKHNIDDDKKMLEEYNREILFYNLPAPIRKGLITLTGNNFPTSEQILKRYEEVVTRLNLTEGAKQNKVITKEKVITSGAQVNDVSTFNVAHKKGKQASETKCLFCGGNHRSQICEKVKDIKTRENAIKTKHPRLCFKCGYNKHPNYNKCFYKTLCHDKDCSGSPKHGRLYCPKFCKGVNNHQINQVSSIPALVHAVGQESKSVALPTGIFFVKDKHAEKLPVEERNLRALLDSAAQKTLISKAAVERLNLKVDSSEKACLLGYGNKRPTNNIFNIVRVLLGLPYSDKKVSVEAYVVDKLNAVHMLGIAKVAKRIQSKGVTIADWMLINTKADIVNFDILVGADHFWKLVNPYKLPIERMGMMLTPDRWGRYLIMGKIPGSSKIPKHQSVNYISINQVGYDQSDLRSHLRAQSQILDANEYVDDSNAFSISRELNSYDALGFQVSSRAENDTEALEAYNSNMYKNEETNQYIVGFPWVNNKAPSNIALSQFHNDCSRNFPAECKFDDSQGFSSQKVQRFKFSQSIFIKAVVLMLSIVLCFQMHIQPSKQPLFDSFNRINAPVSASVELAGKNGKSVNVVLQKSTNTVLANYNGIELGSIPGSHLLSTIKSNSLFNYSNNFIFSKSTAFKFVSVIKGLISLVLNFSVVILYENLISLKVQSGTVKWFNTSYSSTGSHTLGTPHVNFADFQGKGSYNSDVRICNVFSTNCLSPGLILRVWKESFLGSHRVKFTVKSTLRKSQKEVIRVIKNLVLLIKLFFDASQIEVKSGNKDSKKFYDYSAVNRRKDLLCASKYDTTLLSPIISPLKAKVAGINFINYKQLELRICKSPKDKLKSNYGIAYAGFKETRKVLDKASPVKCSQFKETLEKVAAKDFIHEVPLKELQDRSIYKHYINHLSVFTKESSTTKCRKVFYASLYKHCRSSITDGIWRESLLTPHILKVLSRMRWLSNLLILDISKAILRMVLMLSDSNYTRFVFRKDIGDPKGPIVLGRFKSVLF